MKVICSYCRCDMGEKEPLEDESISHGMCDDCEDYITKQLDGVSYDEYLGLFDYPVVLINPEGRVAAANDYAYKLLGKSRDRVRGFLGGEAFECAYARRPEGCGETAHCETCTVRNLVQLTFKTKKAYTRKVVQLSAEQGPMEMIVSTSIKDEAVVLAVHEIRCSSCDLT